MILRLILFLALCSTSFAGVGSRVAVVGRGGGGIAVASGGAPWTGIPVQVQGRFSTGASATTFTYNWSTTPVTGNDIWLFVASDTTINTPAGWTPDVSNVNNQGQYLFHKVAAAEPASVVLTLGAGNITTSGVSVVGIEYAGLPAGSFDSAHKNQNNAVTPSFTNTTGSTGTLSQAAEIVFAMQCWNTTSFAATTVNSWDSGFATAGSATSTGSTNNIALFVATLAASATTALNCQATFDSTTTAQGVIAPYKHN